MQFDALFRNTSNGGLGDACIVEEQVQFRSFGLESLDCTFDCCQVIELQWQKDQFIALSLGNGLLNCFDGSARLLFRPTRNVDLGPLAIENLGQLEPNPGRSARDQDDLVGQVGEVIGGEGWARRENLRELDTHGC